MTRDARLHDPRSAAYLMDLYELNVDIAAGARVAARLAAATGQHTGGDSGERVALAEIRCVADDPWWASASPHSIGRATPRPAHGAMTRPKPLLPRI